MVVSAPVKHHDVGRIPVRQSRNALVEGRRWSIALFEVEDELPVIIGDGRVYSTRDEAEGAMKTVKVCESSGTVGGTGPAVVPAPREIEPR